MIHLLDGLTQAQADEALVEQGALTHCMMTGCSDEAVMLLFVRPGNGSGDKIFITAACEGHQNELEDEGEE